MSKPNPIPEGFTTVTPHLICKDADGALAWYTKALGAKELFRMPGPGGQGVMHAEMNIGSSRVMIGEEMPDWGSVGPKTLGGSPVTIHLYVDDADAAMKKAAEAGAEITMPLEDTFWGDRYGKIKDPYGHTWAVATHTRDVSPEEMEEAMKKMFAGS